MSTITNHYHYSTSSSSFPRLVQRTSDDSSAGFTSGSDDDDEDQEREERYDRGEGGQISTKKSFNLFLHYLQESVEQQVLLQDVGEELVRLRGPLRILEGIVYLWNLSSSQLDEEEDVHSLHLVTLPPLLLPRMLQVQTATNHHLTRGGIDSLLEERVIRLPVLNTNG